MTIKYVTGDIFDQSTDALVNPVNCVGVMGKGLALKFKQRFPRSYQTYLTACHSGDIWPGQPIYVPGRGGERNIIHFPTKDDWRLPAQLSWIRDGLWHIWTNYWVWSIESVAMPRIGCGLGGLRWEYVQPLIETIIGNCKLSVVVVTYDGGVE